MPEDVERMLSLLRTRWKPAMGGGSLLAGYHAVVRPGDVFFAVRATGYHGADHVQEAAARGASVIVHGPEIDSDSLPPGLPAIAVYDALAAYRRAAAEWRRHFNIPVVAVGGSAGKTTTTALIAAALSATFRVLSTRENQNGFWGTPFTLARLTNAYDVAVVEIGIATQGAMADHCAIVQPSVALLTSLGPEHLDGIGSLACVVDEEALLLRRTVDAGNTVLVNRTDPLVRAVGDTLNRKGHVVSYRLLETPDAAADRNDLVGWREDPTTLRVTGLGLKGFAVSCPLPGRHSAENLLAAIAVGRVLGVRPSAIADGLRSFHMAEKGRSQVVHCANGATVICDFFNANPVSTRAAIRMLQDVEREAGLPCERRFFCLGDMGGLGEHSVQHHLDLGQELRSCSPEFLLLLGVASRALYEALQEDFPGKLRHFESHDEMAKYISGQWQSGDVVLIKGGSASRMDRVWAGLVASQALGP